MKQIILSTAIALLILCALWAPALAASSGATLTADGALVGTYPTVQLAVDAVTSTAGSDFVIEIAAGTQSDPVNIGQQPGKSVTLRPQKGATVTFTNTITVDGNGNFNSPETLTIEGLNFDMTAPGAPANCINLALIPPRTGYCYAHNVTVRDCNFRGIEGTTVAVQSAAGGMNNIAIKNCTATDMHSLAQLRAVTGQALIQNSSLRNSQEGVNFYGPANLVVSNSDIRATDYALRSGQASGGTPAPGSQIVVTNSVLENSSGTSGAIVLRQDSARTLNISHSDLTNAGGGPAIQNLYAPAQGEYAVSLVNSNWRGPITDIAPSDVTVIDDPGVPNGPIAPPSNAMLITLITLAAACVVLALLLAYALVRQIC